MEENNSQNKEELRALTLKKIDAQVKNYGVVLYMKGSPKMPSCGFSARAAQALQATGEKFAFVNVLSSPTIYEFLPEYSDWPTFPQLYIGGEFQGGCDITLELAQSGELKKFMQAANKEL